MGDLRTFIADHLAEYRPYYAAGVRVDASGSVAATMEVVEPLLAEPHRPRHARPARGHPRRAARARRRDPRPPAWSTSWSGWPPGAASSSPPPRAARRADAADRVCGAPGVPVDGRGAPGRRARQDLEAQEPLFRRLARPPGWSGGDPLIAIGDDALLEAATFAAAVWLRGVPLVTVPVTTLGLIDTAIGGKGGIDLPGVGRNLLGAIHQPVATILDVALVADEPAGGAAGGAGRGRQVRAARRRCAARAARVGRPRCRGGALAARAASCSSWWSGAPSPSGGWSCWTSTTRAASGSRSTSATRSATRSRRRPGTGSGTARPLPMDCAPRSGSARRWASRPPRSPPGRPHPRRPGAGRPSPSTCRSTEVLGYVEADKKRRDGRLRWVLVGRTAVMIRDDVPAAGRARGDRALARGRSPARRDARGGPTVDAPAPPRDTVAGTDERHLSLYLPGMTAPGPSRPGRRRVVPGEQRSRTSAFLFPSVRPDRTKDTRPRCSW